MRILMKMRRLSPLSVDENGNKMMDFDNSSELEESSSKQNFIYYENNKKKTLTVDRYADLIYNYSPVTAFSSDFYTLENGTIKLIVTMATGSYDDCYQKEYTSSSRQ